MRAIFGGLGATHVFFFFFFFLEVNGAWCMESLLDHFSMRDTLAYIGAFADYMAPAYFWTNWVHKTDKICTRSFLSSTNVIAGIVTPRTVATRSIKYSFYNSKRAPPVILELIPKKGWSLIPNKPVGPIRA
ncbi:hypothetical protein BCR41DRAFT_376011 [Lobosporangium transversale]|uniref:Uncharacterized protein n=1 Tax=Lobosporangium transversale TaxID=64571 RepID=A0A1Y2G6Q9_9FUNG|nr:hypothetical protein BCR41DRAFT_376011 [Lobosporangium transversale]ORY93699.1 hypothetical protein BCR41DRAFT_376011 [Lobosporangium transversale]|eukprot:XP_021875194.1 hypothetical protein BCR41DRAFT_376011 [Lobosporangium transversale]